ncbi:hypothetical protein P3339_17980 [Microbulbifer sp. MLAF003]|uniref:hypothetical protein n=1 Tax=Microbulbifer TaxID=48073 RepID=UPI000381DCC8|nr:MULTISPECIES: hypothetical protein [Microbulbifer]WHI50320.1 hypothetical protein P3339_17980 [Microbulbifer sp. MLAF003]
MRKDEIILLLMPLHFILTSNVNASTNAGIELISELTAAANAICQSPSELGHYSKVHLSADANAKLKGVFKKLGDLSGDINSNVTKESWLGVRQKDLASAMKDANTCKVQVLSMLTKDINVSISLHQPVSNSVPHLNHENGSNSWLWLEPNLNSSVLCKAESGSKVDLLNEYTEGLITWVKVRVKSGSCSGTVGWTGKDNYRV